MVPCLHVPYMLTYHKEKAINKLPGPPSINPLPIWTNSAVPMVPPIPTAKVSTPRTLGGFYSTTPIPNWVRTNQLDMARSERPMGLVTGEATDGEIRGPSRVRAGLGLFDTRAPGAGLSIHGGGRHAFAARRAWSCLGWFVD